MILGKLTSLYGRMIENGELDAPYLQDKGIHLAVVLDSSGHVVGIDSLFVEDGKNLTARRFKVPLPPKGRTGSTPPACLLQDRIDYVLGLPVKAKPSDTDLVQKTTKAAAAQKRFLAALSALPPEVQEDPGVAAVIAFSRSPNLGVLREHEGLLRICAIDGGIASFRIVGDLHPNGTPRMVFERDAVRNHCRLAFDNVPDDALPEAVCSITGARMPIARLHSKIRGISDPDGKRGEATLVSFNENAFVSWGHEGGANAAVSVQAERAYTSSLNALIAASSTRRPVGGVTYVAWSEDGNAGEIDQSLEALFGDGAVMASQDASGAAAIPKAIETGLVPLDDGGVYNVLGLQAAMGRAVIRFWKSGTHSEIRGRLADHFSDFGLGDRRALPLWRILKCVALKGETDKLPPGLAAGIVRSAFDGVSYPPHLLRTATERFLKSRPDSDPNEPRANADRIRCITACLRCSARIGIIKEGVPMGLDKDNTNVAYRLGRLFSIYEQIQRASDPNVNVTIRDSLFGSAARTPSRVFPMLETRSVHHLAKLRKSGQQGLAVHFGKEVDEIMSAFPASGLPERLGPDDLSRYAVGYHHQSAHRKPKKDGVPLTSGVEPDAQDVEESSSSSQAAL